MTKKFFYCKKRIVILLASITLLLTTKIYAAEDPTFKKSNTIYQIINDHEYLLVPLSDAAAGLFLCGPLCALAGATAGAGEEALIYYGYIDKRYLTYGILGGAIGQMFNQALTTTGILSGLFFTDVFKSNSELIVPTFMITLGTQTGGVPGLLLSVAGCVIDKALRDTNVATKNPVASFILVPKFINKALGPGMAALATLYLNVIIYNQQSLPEILNSKPVTNVFAMFPMGETMKNYTRVATKLYDNYDKFIPQKEFQEHFEKNVITLIAGQLLTHWLMVKQILLNQDLKYLFEHLDQSNIEGTTGNPFIAGGIKLAIFIIPWVAGQAVTSSIEKYYNDRLSIILKDNIQKKLYSDENLLRLSNHGNFSVYMDNLNRDTRVITNLGNSLFSGAVSTSIGGAYGTSMIATHSRSLLAYTFLYQMITSMIAERLASQTMAYDEEIKFLYSELLDLYKDSKEHVRTITERDGINITGNRAQKLSIALTEIQGKQNLWNMGLSLFLSADRVLEVIINYYLVGKEIQQGKLPFAKRNLLRKAVMDESDMFSWGSSNLATVGQIEKSLDRLIVLAGITDLLSNMDQIKRTSHDKNHLALHNLEIGVGNRVLVTVDDLKFPMGKVYAITGETGCGKTSLLSKIKGIKENGIYGKGEIYYPKTDNKDPKIVMLSQQDYFPPNSSLQEILSYPDKLTDDPKIDTRMKKEMIILLKEMGLYHTLFTNLNLDSKKNWYTYLSGGEKKKILIISALIKKPDILILDEIFNGLDSKSIKLVEQVLKKYLPNSLILIVDHHARDNNYNSFYASELHFSNKRMVVRDMQ